MYTYNFIALDSQGNPLQNAGGSFYADSDTNLTSPLPVTDQNGVTTSSPAANRLGLVYFTHDTEVRGYWKSGNNTLRVQAWEAADQAAADAATAKDAAVAAAASAAAPTTDAVTNVFATALADGTSTIRKDLDSNYATKQAASDAQAAATAAAATAAQNTTSITAVTSTANTALSTANTVQARLPIIATVDSLPSIVYDAHRGGSGETPENTLQGLRSASAWADVLDLDSQVIGDGTAVLMHDSTVDRTTRATGDVSLFNAAQWGLIRSDPSTWFAANTPDLPVPTVEEVLDQLGGKRVMTVEAKTAAGVPALAKLITDRHLERSVLINTNSTAVVPTIKSYGLLAHLWRSASQMATDNAATIKATGADLLDLDINGTDAQITAAIAQNYPLGVWAHTLVRRTQRDRALGLGCRGIINDYPGYISGKVARRTASTFSTGYWGYGYVPSASTPRPVLDSSGRIPLPPPASINIADSVVLLAGEVSPAPANGTIDVKFSFPTAGSTGWSLFSVHLGSDDSDMAMSSAAIVQNGYTFQVSNDRSLRIYRDDKTAGTTTNLITTATGTTLTANTVYTLHIVITATTLTVSIPEVSGLTATFTDSTYRVPWYVYVGRNYSGPAVGLLWVNSITTS